MKVKADFAALARSVEKRDEVRLKQLGADPAAVNRYQIVCLPENFWEAKGGDELLEAAQTADLAKLLKEAGIQCAMPHEVGFETPVVVRQSADLWCGLIWILDKLAAPPFVAVLSGWLTAKYITTKGDKGERRPKPPTVHVTIGVRKYGQLSTFQYDGDAESLVQLLRGLTQPGSDSPERAD